MTARARAKRDATHARRAAPHVVREVLRTPGEELEPRTREWMEPRFGHDFRHVRVHRDDRAAAAAESLGAEAFTAGRHVVFGAGRYTPAVVAHELSHVTPHEHDADALRVGSAHDPEEKQAEANVTRIASFAGGGAAAPLPNAGGDGAPVIRRLSRAGEIGLAAAIGGVVGGLIVGLATSSVGFGLLGGAISALVVGGLAALATSGSQRQRRPVGRHLAVLLDVNFVPTGTTPQTVTRLPQDTRVIREPAPGGGPAPPANHVHVRVTTGPLLGATGWVDERALEERTNTEILSPEDARRLWDELSRATFLTENGERMPIPFHFPPDGCFARAYRMDQILLEAGYESERVFVASRRRTRFMTEGDLTVQSEYGDEGPGTAPPSVTWWYHVAPLVRVQEPTGQVQRYVLDPSITQGPVTIENWISRMNQNPGDFREVTMDDFRADVQAAGGHTQWEGRVFFTAPATTYGPLRDSPEEPPERTLRRYALEAQTRRLVRALRLLANDANATLPQVLAAIAAATPYARADLVDPGDVEGAQTMAALRTKFGESGYQQIMTALRTP